MAAETSTATTDGRPTLGATIRALREEAGLSRERLARRMGVSSTTIQRWEADANAPYFEGAVALARALEVPIEALAVAYGDPAPTTCYAPHLSLVPELPGQCELDLTGAEPVLRLHAGHGPDRQRAVARRSLAATRLHAVT